MLVDICAIKVEKSKKKTVFALLFKIILIFAWLSKASVCDGKNYRAYRAFIIKA